MLGAISADDAADILEEEVGEDFALLAGTGSEGQRNSASDPLARAAACAAHGLHRPGGAREREDPRDRAGLLRRGGVANTQEAILRYLPLIVGLAGNVGIQSSTIFVRGFLTGEAEPDREWSVFGSEWTVGSIIGVLCGLATWIVAGLIEGGPSGLGLAVGVAVVAAVAWAAMLEGLVPIACRRLGIDPAIVAGPFLIAMSDVSGSVIYILVARSISAL